MLKELYSNKLNMDLQRFGDDIAGLLSKGTALSYSQDGKAYTPVAAVKTVPALGSDPEKVDVTHLQSAHKSYIAGIRDSENLEFAVIYQTKNFAEMQKLEGKSLKWKVTFPDGLEATFTGESALKFSGAEVNGALEFSIVVVVSDGPNFTPSKA